MSPIPRTGYAADEKSGGNSHRTADVIVFMVDMKDGLTASDELQQCSESQRNRLFLW